MLGVTIFLAAGLGALIWVDPFGEHDDDGPDTRETNGSSPDPDEESNICDDIVPIDDFLGDLVDDFPGTHLAVQEPSTPTTDSVPILGGQSVPDENLDDRDGSGLGDSELLTDQFLNGGDNDDLVQGGLGNDFLTGGGGDDEINGGAGDDVLIGTDDYQMTEGDFPFYQQEDDTLIGGDGDDTIIAHSGNAEGGQGSDTFVVSGMGVLKIADFGEEDDLVVLRNTNEFDLAGGQSAMPEIEVRLSEGGTQTEVFVDGECAAILEGFASLNAEQISVILSDDLQSEIWS